jgi:hypothetical protein
MVNFGDLCCIDFGQHRCTPPEPPFAYDSDTRQKSEEHEFLTPEEFGHVTLDRFEGPQWGEQ